MSNPYGPMGTCVCGHKLAAWNPKDVVDRDLVTGRHLLMPKDLTPWCGNGLCAENKQVTVIVREISKSEYEERKT